MKFYTETLGCKVNQFETNAIAGFLIGRGHIQTSDAFECDACIINTCAVTGESARKSRQAVRRLRKLAPGAKIAVCGCYTQLAPEAAAEIGADLIGGSGGRLEFAEKLEILCRDESESATGAITPAADAPSGKREFEHLPLPQGGNLRTRALLKIQDGCDNFCAYCIIPYTRGRVRSLPVAKAAADANKLARDGFREIVITGIEISSYGKDLYGGETLTGVVREIAAATPGVRLRLGSLDPGFIDGEFCRELAAIKTLCGHFHLSLQSGCDETLLRMGRKYNTRRILAAIDELRDKFPDCGITADLITGFPGESDAEFNKTLEFITRAKFSDMHVFPFSARPGTRAAVMSGQVEKQIRRERAATAAAIGRRMAAEFQKNQIGKRVEVLFERERDGFWTGHSENYLEVTAKNGGSRNSVHPVQITAVDNGLVWGEICRP